MPSLTTFTSRCAAASQYTKKYTDNSFGFWIGMGKVTPWYNDDLPPAPSQNTVKIPELYCIVWVSSCLSIFLDSNGEIITKTNRYNYTTTTDPYLLASSKANLVYLESMFNTNETLLPRMYRATGVITEIEFYKEPGTLTVGKVIPADNIKSYFLDWVEYHKPISLQSKNVNHVIQIIREF